MPAEDLIAALAARPPRLSIGYRTRTRAGWDCGWHSHGPLEIVLHHRGAGRAQGEGMAEIPFAAGDLALHAPQRQHRQPGERDGEDWCLQLVLPCRWPADLPALIHLPAAQVEVDVDEWARLTAQPGAVLAPAEALAQDLRAGAILAGFLAALGRRQAAPTPTGDHAERCRDIIESRFASIGLVDEIADELGLSPDRLRHLFSERFGHGPRAHLRRTRLRAAQRLLRETPLTLDEVAVRCGIGNARQLCGLFQELAGCTPGSWRDGVK